MAAALGLGVTPAALAGTSAIALPCGFTRGGLPIGLQLLALLRLATHHGPAGCLEIFGDVPLAPVVASPLGRHSLLAPASPPGPTVEDHVRGRAVEDQLEICVSRQVHARDDEKQPGHACRRRTHEHYSLRCVRVSTERRASCTVPAARGS